MTVSLMLRLPDWAGNRIKEMADDKGLPFATMVKMLVCEKLRENQVKKI